MECQVKKRSIPTYSSVFKFNRGANATETFVQGKCDKKMV